MANNDSEIFNLIGALVYLCAAVVAVVLAVMTIVTVGAAIGCGVGFKNYGKAFLDNVHLERPKAA